MGKKKGRKYIWKRDQQEFKKKRKRERQTEKEKRPIILQIEVENKFAENRYCRQGKEKEESKNLNI